MDPKQERLGNPYDMDEDCQNCPALCETRTQVVHGYGDVTADFVVVGHTPGPGADRTGVPFTGDEAGERLLGLLADLGFTESPPDSEDPDVENVFLTYAARCRDPDRDPTDEELGNCEPYLNAELRMINPEIILPVGQRPLEELALEYTTKRPSDLDAERDHATTIRGRGFEIVPMKPLAEQSDEETAALGDHLAELLNRDYRQTKGRRSR